MFRRLVLLLAGLATLCTAASMRRVGRILSGPPADAYGRVVCCDSDHDSLPEMIFSTGGTVYPPDPLRLEVWEHHGWNRFSIVYADTGIYPPPPGITTGNAIPFAAGDVDDDDLTDIVCITVEPDSANPGLFYCDVITVESPDSFSYPSRLSWYYRYSGNGTIPIPTYLTSNLDGEGRNEIMLSGTWIFENMGNDSNALVWCNHSYGGYLTFGDFDGDGKMEFVTTSPGPVGVWRSTGDDQYEMVWRDSFDLPNPGDVFMTNDIDGDGLPEFYVAFENVPRGEIYLYMWEADHAGTDAYHRTLVDSVAFSGTDWGRWSECGDIDADGTDECIWTTPDIIRVYKAVGDDQLQEVWHWDNDHGGFRSLVSTVYDINNDGYNELITAGSGRVSIFEIDAVDLLSPNGGSCIVGDTVSIRWRVNTPPRCDSLSLFLRRGITPSPFPPPQGGGNRREGDLTDSLWDLDTIATGLPGTDTLYRWVVPSGVPDTGRIVVIAYGQAGGDMTQSSSIGIVSQAGSSGCVSGEWGQSQGATDLGHNPDSPAESDYVPRLAWQFDMSDSAITFIGGGVAEVTGRVPSQWSLSVSPNPARGAFTVRYDVPLTLALSQRERGGVRAVMSLGVYDAGGRLVRSLSDGEVSPGRCEARVPSGALPTGIYFIRLATPGFRAVKKAVVAR